MKVYLCRFSPAFFPPHLIARLFLASLLELSSLRISWVAGQMASMVYALLKTDQETVSKVPPGEAPPAPMLYDPEVHRKHREGHYRSLKPGTLPRKIIQLPKKT